MKTHILLALVFSSSSILYASVPPLEEDAKPPTIVQPIPQHVEATDNLRHPISPSPDYDQGGDWIDQISDTFASIFGGLHIFGWPYISDEEENSPRQNEPPAFNGDLHLLLKNLSTLQSCNKIFDNLQGYSVESLNFSGCKPIVFISFIEYFKHHENSFPYLKLISCVGHKLNPNQIHDLLETAFTRIKGPLDIDLTPASDYNAIILAGLAGRYCLKKADLKIVLTDVQLPKNLKYLNLPKGLTLKNLGEVEYSDLAERLILIRKIIRDKTITLVDGDGSKLVLE